MWLENRETGELHNWSVKTILKEINRDRRSEWRKYNKNDWKEGLEFTEYKLIDSSIARQIVRSSDGHHWRWKNKKGAIYGKNKT